MLYNTNPIICTLDELESRVKDRKITVIETKAQPGYLSRRTLARKERDDRPVFVAGGTRKGQLYYLNPRYDTTRYCWRCYINVTVDDIR